MPNFDDAIVRSLPTTLPLYTPAAHADAWHQVRAPGGYEWWYFDAEDLKNDRRLVAIYFDGFVFHPEYLRRYRAYLKHPTKFSPPIPAQFPCVYFTLYEAGKIRAQFVSRYPAGSLQAASDSPHVMIGPNQMSFDGARYNLQLSEPERRAADALSADLHFSPSWRLAAHERTLLSSQENRAEHHWIIAAPLCDVSGTVHVGEEEIEFRGRGYHDHHFGTSPLGQGLRRWLWGRVLFEDDSARVFRFAQPDDPTLPMESHVLQIDSEGVRELSSLHSVMDWSKLTAVGLRYPATIIAADLHLHSPRVIDRSPFLLRMVYRVRCGGKNGVALCEVAYPHRLSWPVLGRMMEMSITKR